MSLKKTTKAVILDSVVKGEITVTEGVSCLKMRKKQVFCLKAKIRK